MRITASPHTVVGICYARDPATMKPIPYTCRDTVFETETYRVPINRAREARNLAEYEAALPAARPRAAAGTPPLIHISDPTRPD